MQTSKRILDRCKILGGVAAWVLASCGVEQLAGIQGSGSPGSATAVGPITGFGSIFVNGVEYATSGAEILIDDEPGTESELRVGHIVTVKGTVNEDGLDGMATEVSFVGDAQGSVTQVDVDDGTFIVLDQTVQVTDATLFDESIAPASIEGLQAGAVVQVSGFANAAGDVVASRIDLKPAGASSQVKGVVEALDTVAQTFRINTLTVDYSGAAPSSTLANGSTVHVRGTTNAGVLQATRVKVLSEPGGAANERGDVQGLVTSFTSAADFVVNGQRVATDSNTEFVLRGQTLGVNVSVKVKGTFDASGTLVASKVEVKPQSAGTGAGSNTGIVRGLVDSVGNNSLSVLGVDVTISAATAFEDKSQQHLRTFRLSDVRAGDYVEVRGIANEASSGIDADLVLRDEPEGRSYLQGAAVNVAAPNFHVLGITVMTDAQTHFVGFPGSGSGADEFFNEVPNQTVKVRGTFSGGVLLADRVQIKN